MFQSVDGDCKFLGESETARHDSFVIGRCGVEQCQQIPRFSALVELGRFPSNDLEPHPVVATTMIWGLNAQAIPTFNAVGECSDTLQNVGFTPPSWEDLAKGEPPPEEDVESEDDRNIPRVAEGFHENGGAGVLLCKDSTTVDGV